MRHHGTGRPRVETESRQGDPGDIPAWFAGRLPDDWFTGPPGVTVDREEVVVIGTVAAPDLPATASASERAASEAGRAQRFRESTREQRMRLADEAELRFGRKVAWGVQVGETRQLFTTLSVPVMTRLRQPERLVLDTLVEAGVARSRSEALAWCVRLVGQHAGDWLDELRESLREVQRLREQGPTGRSDAAPG